MYVRPLINNVPAKVRKKQIKWKKKKKKLFWLRLTRGKCLSRLYYLNERKGKNRNETSLKRLRAITKQTQQC